MENFTSLVNIDDTRNLLGLMMKSDSEIRTFFIGMTDAVAERWWYEFLQYHPDALAPALLNYIREKERTASTAIGLGLLSLLISAPVLTSIGTAVTFTALNHFTQEQLYRIRNIFIRCYFRPDNHPGEGKRQIPGV